MAVLVRPRGLALLVLVMAEIVMVMATSSLSATTTTAVATSTTTTAATSTPSVYNASAPSAPQDIRGYSYLGCYLEVNGINGTAPGARSLQGRTADEVLPGDMTVPKCLAFCAGGGAGANSGPFAYAGLEYARECWCGQLLAALAVPQPAADCNLPCDGDNSTLCGGALRLTLYYMDVNSAAARPVRLLATVAATAATAAVLLLL